MSCNILKKIAITAVISAIVPMVSFAEEGVVDGNAVRLRTEPSADSKIITLLEKGSVGEVIEASAKKGLVIATSDSAIEITKIQPEGKPMMDARAFCNGGKIKVGDILNN